MFNCPFDQIQSCGTDFFDNKCIVSHITDSWGILSLSEVSLLGEILLLNLECFLFDSRNAFLCGTTASSKHSENVFRRTPTTKCEVFTKMVVSLRSPRLWMILILRNVGEIFVIFPSSY